MLVKYNLELSYHNNPRREARSQLLNPFRCPKIRARHRLVYPSSARYANQATTGKRDGQVGLRQQRTRVSCFQAPERFEELEQGICDLGEGELLAGADARPAAERDVLPAGAASAVSNTEDRRLDTECSRDRNKNTYLTRRPESHRSGRNSSASGPNTSLLRCSEWTDHRSGVPLGTRIGCLPSLPPPRGSTVSLLQVLEFVATGEKRRSARKRGLGRGAPSQNRGWWKEREIYPL
jgi:hypothetical protein